MALSPKKKSRLILGYFNRKNQQKNKRETKKTPVFLINSGLFSQKSAALGKEIQWKDLNDAELRK